MSDPVSWLLIERGWKVVGADGDELGHVVEVDADEEKDIFSGLSVRTSRLGGTQYVPSERVARITEGCVSLDVNADELRRRTG